MGDFTDLSRWLGRAGTLPPVARQFELGVVEECADVAIEEPPTIEPQPISAFTCIIEYDGDTRLITCRRYDLIGDLGYVGAICHSARGYRQFRIDRIAAIFDAMTGESLGDGAYFIRFEPESRRARSPTWGLTPSRKATLVAGLNVLAFMARCDGFWHPLEGNTVESFICSMWLRKEWDGDPAVSEILAHAQRLSPDADTFFKALRHYASSTTSTKILTRAIGDLIAADGVICSEEWNWGTEVDSFFCQYQDDEFEKYFLHTDSYRQA